MRHRPTHGGFVGHKRELICAICLQPFQTYSKSATTCSDACGTEQSRRTVAKHKAIQQRLRDKKVSR